jgi:hypothetical protein
MAATRRADAARATQSRQRGRPLEVEIKLRNALVPHRLATDAKRTGQRVSPSSKAAISVVPGGDGTTEGCDH